MYKATGPAAGGAPKLLVSCCTPHFGTPTTGVTRRLPCQGVFSKEFSEFSSLRVNDYLRNSQFRFDRSEEAKLAGLRLIEHHCNY
jgi:hypothetical protein